MSYRLKTAFLIFSSTLLLSATLAILYRAPEKKVNLLEKPCSPNENFNIGGMVDQNGIIEKGSGFIMSGNGWIYKYLCGPGLIKINATGFSSDSIYPELSINLNGQKLTTFKINKTDNLRFKVHGEGLLTLGYDNDIFKVDLRMATFRNFRIAGVCDSNYRIDTPKESASSWDKLNNSWIVLKSYPAVVLFPCGEGKMQVSAFGQSGKGVFPEIEIKQNKSTLGVYQLKEEETRIEINVDKSPIYIRLNNPFAELLENRDLIINNINFSYEKP